METNPFVAFGSRFKHCPVALIYPCNHVLNSLTRQLIPMSKLGQPFQLTDMID